MKLRTNISRTLVIVSTFLCIALLADAANTNDGTVSDKDTKNMTKSEKERLANSKGEPTPLEQGMEPIFDMVRFFLNKVLQPNEAGPPQVLIQQIATALGAEEGRLFQPSTFLKQMEDNWQPITEYYLGFGICIAIGLVFIILMPIIGFCFCCCRLCGNCGGNPSQMDPRFSRCKHATYTIVLLILATVMLAGVVCAFVTNDLFHIQITDNERGLRGNLNRSVTTVVKYLDITGKELKQDTLRQANTGIDQIETLINRTGSNVLDDIKVISGAGALLNNCSQLADDIPRLKNELSQLASLISASKTDATDVRNKLQKVRGEIKNGLNGCNTNACIDMRSRTDDLVVNIDFTKLPSDIQTNVDALAQYEDLSGEIDQARKDLDRIGTEITSQVQFEIENTVRELENTKQSLKTQVENIEAEADNVKKQLLNVDNILEKNYPRDNEVSRYSIYVGVGLSCILLLIVLLIYMGMMFGVCGERPYDDARFCNKGVGANFLLASVGLMFLFAALLMFITMVLFIVGAPLQTEVCRHLMKPLDSPFLDRIDSYLSGTIGQLLYGDRSTEKLTIREILTKCDNNTAIYSALQLNRTYDLESVLDEIITQTQPKIQQVMDTVKGQAYRDIKVIPDEMKIILTAMKKDPGLQQDFKPAMAELSQTLLGTDLQDFIHDLENMDFNSFDVHNAIKDLKENTGAAVQSLQNQVTQLKQLVSSTKRINDISAKVSDIEQQIAAVDAKLGPAEQAQTIAAAADRTTQRFVDVMKTVLAGVTNSIKNEVGRCRPLYDAYNNLANATCRKVLDPFNGFWVGLGLYLILFIPSIILAVKLAALYRKTEFEGIGGWKVYPEEHIPLEEVNRESSANDAPHQASYVRKGLHRDNRVGPNTQDQ